jgi:hypothetical protein
VANTRIFGEDTMRRLLLHALVFLSAIVTPRTATAAGYPDRAVRVIVG